MKNRADLYAYANGEKFKGKRAEEIFTAIMTANTWEGRESLSGSGSELSQTSELLRVMPSVFQQFKIKTMLDAPCGDFNWMRLMDFSAMKYTGGDIVRKLIDNNQEKYAGENISFLQMDLLEEIPGKLDLLFCRDCLVHLSFADIFKVLKNIKRSQIRYFMTTTFPGESNNTDITTGGWRPLNFMAPPFQFPQPVFLLNEKCTEMDGAFDDKSMGLWEVAQLPSFF